MRHPRRYLHNLWTRTRYENSESATSAVDNEKERRRSDASSSLRRVMPDLYFVNTPAAHMVRHWDLLRRLPTHEIQLDFYRHEGARLSNLTICGLDSTEAGLLSKVSGTLTAFDIDVKSALIYTARGEDLHNELARIEDSKDAGFDSSRGIVLDTLVLSEAYHGRERALSLKTQARVENELRRVLHGEITVAQLMSKRRTRPPAPIIIHDLKTSRLPEQDIIRIKLQTQDGVGILYRTTSALSALDLSIRIAQINTHDGVTDDTFYVSAATGATFSTQDCEALNARLRALLQNSTVSFGLND